MLNHYVGHVKLIKYCKSIYTLIWKKLEKKKNPKTASFHLLFSLYLIRTHVSFSLPASFAFLGAHTLWVGNIKSATCLAQQRKPFLTMKEERRVSTSCAVTSLLYLHCSQLVCPQILVLNPISYPHTGLRSSEQGEMYCQSYKPVCPFLMVLEPTPATCGNMQYLACSAGSWATDDQQDLKAAQSCLSHMDSVIQSTDTDRTTWATATASAEHWACDPAPMRGTHRHIGRTHTYTHTHLHTLRQAWTRPFFTTSSSSLPLMVSWKTLNMLVPGGNTW